MAVAAAGPIARGKGCRLIRACTVEAFSRSFVLSFCVCFCVFLVSDPPHPHASTHAWKGGVFFSFLFWVFNAPVEGVRTALAKRSGSGGEWQTRSSVPRAEEQHQQQQRAGRAERGKQKGWIWKYSSSDCARVCVYSTRRAARDVDGCLHHAAVRPEVRKELLGPPDAAGVFALLAAAQLVFVGLRLVSFLRPGCV